MVASTDARMFQMDIKDFFLQSVIPEPEYLKIKMTQIPEEIIDELNLIPLVDSKGVRFIYAEVNRAMYGLKQSNIISEKELQSNLAKHDIYQTEIKGLFRHKTRSIIFGLHVDDVLSIAYAPNNQRKLEDAIFLKQAMEQCGYKLKVNLAGLDQPSLPTTYQLKYTGINITHDTKERYVKIDMNDYYDKLVASFTNIKPRETPGKPCDIKYGATEQHEHHDSAIGSNTKPSSRGVKWMH
jgi:hypothetical protein